MKFPSLLPLFTLLLLIASCQQEKKHPEFVVKEVEKPVLGRPEWIPGQKTEPKVVLTGIARGEQIYQSTCIQCHNKDPNIAGAIGPRMVDAPLEVMTSKVMTGKYPDPLPPGFVPKRKTRAMRPLPQFEAEIPLIYEYVQSVKK